MTSNAGPHRCRLQPDTPAPVGVDQPVFLTLQAAQRPAGRHIPHRARATRQQETAPVHRVVGRREAGPPQDCGGHVAGTHQAAGQGAIEPGFLNALQHVAGRDATNSGGIIRIDGGDASAKEAAPHAEIAPAVHHVAKAAPQAMPPRHRRADYAIGDQYLFAIHAARFQVGGEDPHPAGRLLDFQFVPRLRHQRLPGGQDGCLSPGYAFQYAGFVGETQAQAVIPVGAPQHKSAKPVADPPETRRQRGQRIAGIQQRHRIRRRERGGHASRLTAQRREPVVADGQHFPSVGPVG